MTCIGFTRPSIRLKASVEEAESLGFRVLAAPSLEISAGDPEQFERAKGIICSGKADFTVFGSATSVEECGRTYGDGFAPMMGNTKVVSIGPNTSRWLEDAGISPDMVPDDYSSYGIVDMLGPSIGGKTVVLLRSDRGSPILSEGLRRCGADVVDIAAYKLTPHGGSDDLDAMMDAIRDGDMDVMCFTSPMSAESFFGSMTDRYGASDAERFMGDVMVAAIGRPTSEALSRLGRTPDVVPRTTTFRDMLLAVRERCSIS